MSQYDALIDQEEKVIRLLRSKLAQREDRLKSLKALKANPDSLDLLLEKELLGSPALVPMSSTSDGAASASPVPAGDQVKIPLRVLKVLNFIGPLGKSLSAITDYMVEQQMIAPGEDKKVRRLVYEYKTVRGLLDSSQRAFYKLTAVGNAAVTAQVESHKTAGVQFT